MELFEDLLSQAQKQYEIADHLLSVTYPLVSDPKMLPSILNRLYHALDYALTAWLRFERNQGKIKTCEDSFESKLALFRQELLPKYKLKLDTALFLQEIRSLVLDHERTAVEFSRKEKLVMVENSQVSMLDEQKLKTFLSKTKVFIEEVRNKVRTHLLAEEQ